jgi:hypothetical protein
MKLIKRKKIGYKHKEKNLRNTTIDIPLEIDKVGELDPFAYCLTKSQDERDKKEGRRRKNSF